MLATFRTIATLPEETIGAYVISMTSAASDVLAVRLLQKVSGVAHPMRVSPLFETRDDLVNCATVMDRVFGVAPYLEAICGKHEIMLGYSDSSKDAGKV